MGLLAVAVIFISHNMEHVLEVAGRIVVLRLGRKVLDARRSELDVNGLIAAITGLG